MDTTQKLKDRFPDLKFVKPTPVLQHPRYKPYNVQFSPNRHLDLPKGHVKEDGRKHFLVDSVADLDTPIPMRDGVHVYGDIFRPKSSDETKVPAVICWSPYGKSSISIDMVWHRSGVPKDWTSGYETFEGLDPSDWCKRGYAVVNMDARGCQFSEGTYFFWGDQEAEDIHDTVDYLSRQPWCNGSVCMGGNSYLGKAQVSAASRMTHPALKAIAPWEGFTDIYRQLFRRGGIDMNNKFAAGYVWGVAGEHEVEDIAAMVKSHPHYDDYWAAKNDPVENIEIPLYVLGSFSNPFHTAGSFHTYREARSKQKWIRVHSTFEWYEMYEKKSNDDLQRFYDRYCKGIMNGWESDTPPVRLSLLGLGSVANIVERPETEFPLRRQQLKKFYLNAETKTLQTSMPDTESSVSHDSHNLAASSDFTLQFSEYTEFAGYAKIRLWMSCDDKDDMDVVIQIRKIDRFGQLLTGVNFPCPVPESEVLNTSVSKTYGPQGFLRASALASRNDARCSADGQEVFYDHDRSQKVPAGTVVPLEITPWPHGVVFGEGEGVMLRVAGHVLSLPVNPMLALKEADDENVGRHHVHTGGKYDSCLILPIIAGGRP